MFALTAVLWFATLDHNTLIRPDEGRYAEIPREMVATGDWTTPRLNDLKYFEKPALQYWATATAYTLFGEHHWTARLWAALTGFLGLLLAYYTGLRLYGQRAGYMAAMVLASSFLYFAIGHINILDMGVSFFMNLSLAAILLAQRPNATPSENRWWMYVCWAGMGLSMLSKGLIGVAIPGAVLIIYTLMQREWVLWTRLHIGMGLLIFAAITVPWFVLVSQANPEFLWFFFIHEHVLRYLTSIHGRVHPWYTFIPVVIIGILPWLLPMLSALKNGWSRGVANGKAFQTNRMLMVWIVFIFLFFSTSHSKLVPYIVPIFPALALLIGERLSKMSGKIFAWQTSVMIPISIAVWFAAPLALKSASAEVPASLYAGFVPWIQGAAVCWLVGSVIAIMFARRERIVSAVTVLSIAGLLMAQAVYLGYNALSPASGAYAIAQQVKPYLKPNVPFYSVAMYEQTLPPYLARTMTLVAHPDEMQFGLEQEPHKWIADIATFKQVWRKQSYALAVMSPPTYQQFVNEGLPMREIARDTRRVVVITP